MFSATFSPSSSSTPVTITNMDDQIFEGTVVLLTSISGFTNPMIMINENNTFSLTVVDDEGRLFEPRACTIQC